jgi:hypothetical protein
MITYISGKITGLTNWEINFHLSALSVLMLGYIPINPAKIKPLFGIKTYWCYMIADIWELLFCDAIYMQSNWKDSRGARIEYRVAKLIGLKIIFE